uniref:Uncharacterized protein n=1 Tax=Cacopsylla melanoneura TaxID=428564 RepID=A0A8D8PSH9_9HEMI
MVVSFNQFCYPQPLSICRQVHFQGKWTALFQCPEIRRNIFVVVYFELGTQRHYSGWLLSFAIAITKTKKQCQWTTDIFLKLISNLDHITTNVNLSSIAQDYGN